MVALTFLLLNLAASIFKPKSRLEAENAALRHQLSVLQRKMHGRVQFKNSDRLFFIQLYRWFPSVLKAITIIQPETLVRWHRAGFRRYWRCKSRNLEGRPQISADLQALIRRMSIENALWGAPRIHGELLKLGFAVAQSTVAKYMAKKGDPSGQSWGTFLRNHMLHIAAMDLFVVPTISFNLLYVLVIVRLARRELLWIDVTGLARCSAGRKHCVACAGRRTSSPICPNLNFRHTQVPAARKSGRDAYRDIRTRASRTGSIPIRG
jgi:hypothetical protein